MNKMTVGVMALCAPVLAQAQSIVIDDFSTDQVPMSAGESSFAVGAGIIGGERDLFLEQPPPWPARVEVIGGHLIVNNGTLFLTYDGVDGDLDLDPVGLGGVDLTGGGTQNAFLVRVSTAGVGSSSMYITAHTNASNEAELNDWVEIDAAGDYIVPFFAFAQVFGSDFSNIGALSFELDAADGDEIDLIATTSVLTARLTDALLVDNDSDTRADPGDVLRYTAVIENFDDASDFSVDSVVFTLTPDANTTLDVGSVASSLGTVTTGNTAGDTTVAVDIGTLADNTSATITVDVVINDPFPPMVMSLSAQGLVSFTGASILTDDPDDGTSNADPTVTTSSDLPVELLRFDVK